MSLVWVIGSGGLLGQALISELSNPPVDLFDPGVKFNWGNQNKICEQLRQAALHFSTKAAHRPWTVYWAAGIGNMHSLEEDLQEETHVLERFISILLEMVDLPLSLGTFVFASSAGAIYAGTQKGVITESTPPAPINAYGRIKLVQESLINKLNKNSHGARVITCRISTIYGFKKITGKQQGLLSEIARRIISNQVIHIYVPLETMRDFITAKDAAKKMICTTQQFEKIPGVYLKIIASEVLISIAQILAIFKRICKRNLRVVTQADLRSAQYQRVVQFKSEIAIVNEDINRTNIVEGIACLLAAIREDVTKHSNQSSQDH
jgi:UDP-glucose 4-epimerase